MQLINPSANVFNNLSTSMNKSMLDPKQYEGFTVKVGKETSPEGILGGTLSQKDYDKFKEIVKDVNVKDASRNDMLTLYRGLIDAKLLTYDQVNFGDISGSIEFGPDGKGINQDAKYNQWDYQQKQLPTYAGSEFNESRGGAINAMKLIAAVANTSPVTGATVAKETYSPQDLNYSSGNTSSYQVNFSALAQRLSRGEKVEELDAPKDVDIAELVKQLERLAQAQRATEAANLAAEQLSPSSSSST